MSEDRRDKFMKRKDNVYTLSLDIETLNVFCSFAVSQSEVIKRRDLAALNDLMSLIDEQESSSNNIEKVIRYRFIRKALEARLTKGYTNIDVIFSFINDGLENEYRISKYNLRELNDNEIQWTIESVFSLLKTYNVETYVGTMHELCSDFKNSDYTKRIDSISKIEDFMIDFRNELRKNSSETVTESIFSLRDNVFSERIRKIHEELNDPYNKIKSGMQGFNQMINGGFQAGRVYCILGLPGEGKSLLLLNLAYQIKKHNKTYTLKDPTKTPCVVFLTMENSEAETIDRLFVMSANVSLEEDSRLEDITNRAKNVGELYLSKDNPIDIVVKFVPANSVTTDYLYTLHDELEDNGYEPICLIQDYLKCIKSSDSSYRTDLRLELGAVTKEFKTFALTKSIPVITASQFNRDGISSVDAGRRTNRIDTVSLLDRSNIGESMLILENVDATIFIVPEWDENGRKYMGMRLVKKRFKGGNREMLFQPFEEDNEIRLIDDEGRSLPEFKQSMSKTTSDSNLFNKNRQFETESSTIGLKPKTIFRADGGMKSVFETFINKPAEETKQDTLVKPFSKFNDEEIYELEKVKYDLTFIQNKYYTTQNN